MHRRNVFLALAATSWTIGACGWDPRQPFDRAAPEVNQAIAALDGGDASVAAITLEDYLSTGRCKEGSIGTPEIVKRRADGAFDLGLSLFAIGEGFGRRFGDEELDAGPPEDERRQQRSAQIGCALQIVQAIAADPSVALELRARARYLEGNLHFLGTDYEEAVRAYDEALRLAPGQLDAGDPIGRDAAWNRAIALRRIDDKKDAGPPDSGPPEDASKDARSPDAARDAQSPDGGRDKDSGAGQDSGNGDGGKADGGGAGPDGGHDAASPPPQGDAGPPPPSRANQDERILDQLENAPTVQQEDAKKRASQRRVHGMVDK